MSLSSTLFGSSNMQSPLSARGRKIQDKTQSKLQLSAIGQANRLFKEDPTASARSAVEREAGAVTSGARDAIRDLQSKVAQRGMGQSSVGLSAEAGLRNQAATQANIIRASLPERIRALRAANIQGLLSTSGQLMGQPGAQQINMGRPGIAPALMGAAGGVIGGLAGASAGPQGAAMGASTGFQVGSGTGSALSSSFRR